MKSSLHGLPKKKNLLCMAPWTHARTPCAAVAGARAPDADKTDAAGAPAMLEQGQGRSRGSRSAPVGYATPAWRFGAQAQRRTLVGSAVMNMNVSAGCG